MSICVFYHHNGSLRTFRPSQFIDFFRSAPPTNLEQNKLGLGKISHKNYYNIVLMLLEKHYLEVFRLENIKEILCHH